MKTYFIHSCFFFFLLFNLISHQQAAQIINGIRYSDAETTLTEESLFTRSIPNIKIDFVDDLHIHPASAPLAPTHDGKSYLMYSDAETKNLFVVQLYANGVKIDNSQCDIGIVGKPLDIVATPYGFAAVVRYNSNYKLSLIGYTKDCVKKFEKTIMNNQRTPTDDKKATINQDQINFFTTSNSDDSSTKAYGMEAMFEPNNGRLQYGDGRLGLVFGHYNLFLGTKGSHQGDSILTFDSETGQNVKLGYGANMRKSNSWGCSHSLKQANLWDGERFVIVSLTDAFPMKIIANRCEGSKSNDLVEVRTGTKNRVDCVRGIDLIEGNIVGDCGGQVAGRLGGLVHLNENEYGMVYSRRSASHTQNAGKDNEKTFTNNVNEIALVVFDENLNVIRTKKLLDGSNNNLLHIARYGKNILVGYSTSTCIKPNDSRFICPAYKSSDSFYLRLVDPENGDNLGEIEVDSLPSSDDFETLAVNDRVVWITYDREGSLTYNYLERPF